MFAIHQIAAIFAQTSNDLPDDNGYVWAAYGLAIVLIAAYAVFTIRRGRAVSRQLPPEDRRWS